MHYKAHAHRKWAFIFPASRMLLFTVASTYERVILLVLLIIII